MNSKQRTNKTEAGADLPQSFASFDLAEPLRQAVKAAGYDTPTPIQQAAIPLVLDGVDLIGCAQTGTGKTAAFALPILQRLLDSEGEGGRNDRNDRGSRRIRTLVLAPTRELAAQIADSFKTYGARTNIGTTVVFGGVKKPGQIRALRQAPSVLVATPGRLLDLLSDKALSLAHVEYVVLDEADRMLDMGFIHDVRRILGKLPERRQTLLFSATMPREVEKLAKQFMSNPKRIAVDPVSSVREPIDQTVHFVDKKKKVDLLVETLRNDLQALVFSRTKHGANKVVRKLASAGISAAAIHGNKSQSARESALASFKSGKTRVVVATDLASRGLDIKELPLVINFDLPNEPEVYIHRIGRTGRAGSDGTAVSFCSRDELAYLNSIERLTGHKIERIGSSNDLSKSEAFEQGEHTRPARPSRSGQNRFGAQGARKRDSSSPNHSSGRSKSYGTAERSTSSGPSATSQGRRPKRAQSNRADASASPTSPAAGRPRRHRGAAAGAQKPPRGGRRSDARPVGNR